MCTKIIKYIDVVMAFKTMEGNFVTSLSKIFTKTVREYFRKMFNQTTCSLKWKEKQAIQMKRKSKVGENLPGANLFNTEGSNRIVINLHSDL